MENECPTPVPNPNGILTSPVMRPQRRFGDRFIPTRAGNTWDLTSTMHFPATGVYPLNSEGNSKNSTTMEAQDSFDNSTSLYSYLLLNETLGYQFQSREPKRKVPANRRLFHYDTADRAARNDAFTSSPFTSSPISPQSETLCMRAPRKVTRPRIHPSPFKMLDAPSLQDDFYLNLIDWSSKNCVAIGLGTCAYVWCASTNCVTCICDLYESEDRVTSIAWNETADLVALGTQSGLVNIWDPAAQKLVCVLTGHTGRVGALAWNGSQLSAGSQYGRLTQKDIRAPDTDSKAPTNPSRRLFGHSLEICGLKWSPDKAYLASGGNDNRVRIWSPHSNEPVQCFSHHVAAVKALAWSPHRHGLLASGGGTVDKCIRLWDTLTGLALHKFDTGSQVCNLAWSKHANELVSTHGFSNNEVVVWNYQSPTLKPIIKLRGHTNRVVYMAMSPDGEVIVTGAGTNDETLRFWKIFNKVKRRGEETMSELTLHRKF